MAQGFSPSGARPPFLCEGERLRQNGQGAVGLPRRAAHREVYPLSILLGEACDLARTDGRSQMLLDRIAIADRRLLRQVRIDVTGEEEIEQVRHGGTLTPVSSFGRRVAALRHVDEGFASHGPSLIRGNDTVPADGEAVVSPLGRAITDHVGLHARRHHREPEAGEFVVPGDPLLGSPCGTIDEAFRDLRHSEPSRTAWATPWTVRWAMPSTPSHRFNSAWTAPDDGTAGSPFHGAARRAAIGPLKNHSRPIPLPVRGPFRVTNRSPGERRIKRRSS